MATLIGMILVTSAVGFVFNHFVMPSPVLNFMLMGMAFSAAFSNMVTEERLEQIMQGFNPILGIAMIIVILNLGAPLDYHLILGALEESTHPDIVPIGRKRKAINITRLLVTDDLTVARIIYRILSTINITVAI